MTQQPHPEGSGRQAQGVTPIISEHRAPEDTARAPDGPPGEPNPSNIGTFYAFRFRDYRLLWLGSAFTSAAQWIQQTTMGWVVYDLTGSGTLLGSVNAMRGIPTLLVTPIAGLTADRVSRNRIIAVSQLSLFVTTFLLALGLTFHRVQVWHLFLFMLLVATAQSFNMPARQTMVFDLVPRYVVPNAVALNNLAGSMTRTAGPMVGGALIVLFGAANNFFIQGLAYLCVMITVLLIRLPSKPASSRRRSFFRDIGDGYSFVFRTPQARLLILVMVINPLFLIPLHLALLPIFAKNIFEGGASSLGILLGAIGAGGFLGGLITAALNRVDRRGLLQLYALIVYSLSQAAFSLVGYLTGNLWLAVGFLVSAGAAESISGTTNQTVLQLLAPDHLRGRITSALQFNPLVMSVGVLMGGILADIMGAPAVGITLSLIAFGVAVAIFTFSPRMRDLRLSQLGQQAGQSGRSGARTH